MATIAPSLSQLPVSQSMGTGVVLVGTGTTWKTGTAPSLSVSGVTGTSINTNNSPGWWVLDDTHVSLQLTTGATTGTLTISDATSGASCTVVIGAQIVQPLPHYLVPSATTTVKLVGIGTAWPLAQIAAPTITPGGSFAGSTTYYYQLIAHTGAGTTIGSTATPTGPTSVIGRVTNGNATLDGTNYNVLTWVAVGGATSYDVLVWNGSAWVLVANTTALTLNDQGQGRTAYTVPTTNTSGTNPSLTPSGVTGVTVGAITNTDSTHCTASLTTGATAGTLKLSDSVSGAWTYLTVQVADTAHALTLLSLNCHADASSNGYGTFGNTYNTQSGAQAWRSYAGNALPQWLAYDLSGVTSANRQQILVCLRTSNGDGDYSQSWTNTDNSHNMPVTFLLEGNTGAGGGSAPASGWVPLHQRSGVQLSQQNIVVNFAGYNWLRLTVLGVRGQPVNWDAQAWMDVYDFSGPSVAAGEMILFIGDSITGNACTPNTPQGYVPGCYSIGEIINARLSTKYPSITVNANPFCATADVMGAIATWVSDFPGKYVLIAFGGQDAINNVSQAAFLSNLTAIYNTINTAGKTMILGKFPWNETPSVQTSGLNIRPAIDSLWSTYPGIVHGPDFWLFYAGRNDLYQDPIHPNVDGSSLFRELWRDALMEALYSTTVIHTTRAESAATYL